MSLSQRLDGFSVCVCLYLIALLYFPFSFGKTVLFFLIFSPSPLLRVNLTDTACEHLILSNGQQRASQTQGTLGDSLETLAFSVILQGPQRSLSGH